MKEFVKKHYLLVTNIIFAIAYAIFWIFDLTFLDYWLFIADMIFFVRNIVYGNAAIFLPILITMNILSYTTVKAGKKSGVVLSALLGFIGGFIAVHTVKKDYFGAKAINVFFSIYFWIIAVYPNMVEFLLHLGEFFITYAIFLLIIFLFGIKASRVISIEKLLTINLLSNTVLSVIAAFVLNSSYYDLFYKILIEFDKLGWVKYLIAVIAFVIAILPNIVLYLKNYNNEKENYSFKTHIYKTLIVCICNFQAICVICYSLYVNDIVWLLDYNI